MPNRFRLKINSSIKKSIDYASYRDLVNQGHGLLVFEEVFKYFNFFGEPLVVITPVKNGKIFIEGTEPLRTTNGVAPKFIHIDKQNEWYSDYIDSEGFHFDKLINDDFFEAIRILYNAKQYVSSMKLLMICVDTISYLEYGDVQRNFINWIKTYVALNDIEISSDELWEFRNSLLHMTNLDSRKVQSGQVKRLMFYISNPATKYIKETDEGKAFNFKELLDKIAEGISKWANTYNIQKEKFQILLNRYDRIISDKRMTIVHYSNQFNKD